jgi:nitroreductase
MILEKDTQSPWNISEANFPKDGTQNEQLQYLIRYALLAPSSHNTQPWKFSIQQETIHVYSDPSRWLQVADSDQRELYISVGCALENLLITADHFGFKYALNYFPDPSDEALVTAVRLSSSANEQSASLLDLFPLLTKRQTNHQVYLPRPIPEADLHQLSACCDEKDLFLYLTDDLETKRKVEALIVKADALEFANPAYREELGHWIGQGAFGTSWLMSKMGQLAVTYLNMGKPTAKKDAEVLMSSPVLGIICSKTNDRISQVKVGQLFERLYLTASMLGLSIQPMSQILHVQEIKADVQALLPDKSLFPQQTFRLGYAKPEQAHTPRRTLQEVLISTA